MGEDDNVSELGSPLNILILFMFSPFFWSDDMVIEDDEGGEFGIGRKRKKRKFKFESIEKRNFIIKFLFSLCLLEAYFIGIYFVSINLHTSLK